MSTTAESRIVESLKITQIKSKISERPKARNTLRSLGLHRIGQSVFRENNSQNRGYVRSVAHLVQVEEINGTSPTTTTLQSDARARRSTISDSENARISDGGETMNEELVSEINRGDGHHLFDDGNFFEWHRQGADRSLIWSTERSAAELVGEAAVSLGAMSDRMKGVLVMGSVRRFLPGSEIAKLVQAHPTDVEFLRIEFANGVALLWSPISGNSAFGQENSYREASVIFDADSALSVESAIRATATMRVGRLATSIVSHVAA